MRIAMMTNNYKPVVGGVPIAVERLAEGLRERGHEVYIFAPQFEGYEQEETFVIRYHAFHKKAGGYVPLMKPVDLEMERTFEKLNFDIIHVHHPVLIGWRALYLGKKYHVPVVFTYHTQYEQYLHYWKPYRWLKERGNSLDDKLVDFIENQLVLAVIRRFTEKCSLVFVPTNQIQTMLKEREWEVNTTVMPTGLPEKAYLNYVLMHSEEKWNKEAIRNLYGNGKKYLLCTASRLSAEKNLKFLFRSLAMLKEKMGDRFQFLVIGDGPQRQELEEEVRQMGLESNVTFMGIVPNEQIATFHCASDLFLFASKSETQGIVLLEAMAGGSPVIAVQAAGVSDVVQDGRNGFLSLEVEEVFACLTEHLLLDTKLYQRLSEGAMETAEHYRNSSIAWIAECNYERVLSHQRTLPLLQVMSKTNLYQ